MRKKILIVSSVILALCGMTLMSSLVFFVRAVKVPTGAMANTIIPGDHLIVNRAFGEIGRGEIVTFRYPKDPSIQYVGRVIGLPGEAIQVRGRSILINGNELPEQRVTVESDLKSEYNALKELSSEGSGSYKVYYFLMDDATRMLTDHPDLPFGTAAPFRIPDNQYFIMGDNRDNSLDSRSYGTVPRNLIWGNPTVIYWSEDMSRSHDEAIRWERILKRVQ